VGVFNVSLGNYAKVLQSPSLSTLEGGAISSDDSTQGDMTDDKYGPCVDAGFGLTMEQLKKVDVPGGGISDDDAELQSALVASLGGPESDSQPRDTVEQEYPRLQQGEDLASFDPYM
jgi:hypothetical protein